MIHKTIIYFIEDDSKVSTSDSRGRKGLLYIQQRGFPIPEAFVDVKKGQTLNVARLRTFPTNRLIKCVARSISGSKFLIWIFGFIVENLGLEEQSKRYRFVKYIFLNEEENYVQLAIAKGMFANV